MSREKMIEAAKKTLEDAYTNIPAGSPAQKTIKALKDKIFSEWDKDTKMYEDLANEMAKLKKD